MLSLNVNGIVAEMSCGASLQFELAAKVTTVTPRCKVLGTSDHFTRSTDVPSFPIVLGCFYSPRDVFLGISPSEGHTVMA